MTPLLFFYAPNKWCVLVALMLGQSIKWSRLEQCRSTRTLLWVRINLKAWYGYMIFFFLVVGTKHKTCRNVTRLIGHQIHIEGSDKILRCFNHHLQIEESNRILTCFNHLSWGRISLVNLLCYGDLYNEWMLLSTKSIVPRDAKNKLKVIRALNNLCESAN